MFRYVYIYMIYVLNARIYLYIHMFFNSRVYIYIFMCDFWKIRLEDGDLERRIFQIVILTGIHISTAPA